MRKKPSPAAPKQIGSALLNHAQTQGWIKRHQGYREVTINEKGNKAFAQYFNITI
ncbi:TPA: hypothetical protein ACPFP3_000601 [Proteus mirabilis]